jgi:hypothetical protein
MKTIARIDLNPTKPGDTWETVAHFAAPGDAYNAAAHWQLGPQTGRIRVMSWTGKHWICTYNRPAGNVIAEQTAEGDSVWTHGGMTFHFIKS